MKYHLELGKTVLEKRDKVVAEAAAARTSTRPTTGRRRPRARAAHHPRADPLPGRPPEVSNAIGLPHPVGGLDSAGAPPHPNGLLNGGLDSAGAVGPPHSTTWTSQDES